MGQYRLLIRSYFSWVWLLSSPRLLGNSQLQHNRCEDRSCTTVRIGEIHGSSVPGDPRSAACSAYILPESDSGKSAVVLQPTSPQATPIPVFPGGSQPSLLPLPPVPAPTMPAPTPASPATERAGSVIVASDADYYPMRVMESAEVVVCLNSRALLVKDGMTATFIAGPMEQCR